MASKEVRECKNVSSLLHHCAAYGRDWTAHVGPETRKSDAFVFVRHDLVARIGTALWQQSVASTNF